MGPAMSKARILETPSRGMSGIVCAGRQDTLMDPPGAERRQGAGTSGGSELMESARTRHERSEDVFGGASISTPRSRSDERGGTQSATNPPPRASWIDSETTLPVSAPVLEPVLEPWCRRTRLLLAESPPTRASATNRLSPLPPLLITCHRGASPVFCSVRSTV